MAIVLELKNRKGDPERFEYPETLDEIKLGDFIEFKKKVTPKKPASMLKVETECKTLKEKTEAIAKLSANELGLWYRHFLREIRFWTGIPEETALFMNRDEALNLRNGLEQSFNNYKGNLDRGSFTVENDEGDIITLFMPPSLLVGRTLGEFLESIQMENSMKRAVGGDYIALLDIIAVICRKEGEAYYDGIENDRRPYLKNLPLSIALDVSFFLMKLRNTLTKSILSSVLDYQKKEKEPKASESGSEHTASSTVSPKEEDSTVQT